MKKLHNLLESQLKAYMGDLDSIPPEWHNFLEVVSKTYFECDVKAQIMEAACVTRQQAEEKLRASEARLRQITDSMLDLVSQTSRAGIYEWVSPSHKTILGYEPDNLLGKSIYEFVHSEDLDNVINAVNRAISTSSPGKLEFRYRHADGHYLWLECNGNLLFDANGHVIGAVFNGRDITERRKMEEQLKYLSLHDALTGLYNRTYFEEQMRLLEKNRRCQPVGIILCDIDGLKLVNDTLGHEAGDNLLTAAAQVLRSSFRQGDIIARIGGDEFAVLLPNNDRPNLARASRRIKEAVARYNQGEVRVPLSLSVGFAVAGDSGGLSEAFKEADNNMYREKLAHSQNTGNAIVRILMKALAARDTWDELGQCQEDPEIHSGEAGRTLELPKGALGAS